MQSAKAYLILTILCALLYLPGIASIPIVDRDSPHFAQATKQMLETGNYWQINFQNKPRHLKPPGIYWLQALSVKIFGNNPTKLWPYRIPAILGAWLSVLFTFGFSRKKYGNQIAGYAAAILASSLLLVVQTKLIVTDAALLLTIVLMQFSLWHIYCSAHSSEKISYKFPLLFWLAMSFGIVIKGMTPLIALLTILVLIAMDRKVAWLKELKAKWGIPLVLFLSLAWLIPLSIASHSNFLYDMVSKDLLPKVVSGQESHGMYPGYYMLFFPIIFWPGSLFYWNGAVFALKQRENYAERFLLIWFASNWIFFECIPTKLPQYVLPIFPACAILVANSLWRLPWHSVSQKWRYWIKTYYFLWSLYGITAAVIILLIPYRLEGSISFISIIPASLILLASVLGPIFAFQNKSVTALRLMIVITVLALPVLFHQVLPNLNNLWLSNKVMAAIKNAKVEQLINDQNPLLSVGYGEPSLVFLLGTHKVEFTNLASLLTESKTSRKRVVLLDQEDFIKFSQQNVVWQDLAVIKGYNYGNGNWMTLHLITSST